MSSGHPPHWEVCGAHLSLITVEVARRELFCERTKGHFGLHAIFRGPQNSVQWRDTGPVPSPCYAKPGTDLVHLDGGCRCFVGGPAPEHQSHDVPDPAIDALDMIAEVAYGTDVTSLEAVNAIRRILRLTGRMGDL